MHRFHVLARSAVLALACLAGGVIPAAGAPHAAHAAHVAIDGQGAAAPVREPEEDALERLEAEFEEAQDAWRAAIRAADASGRTELVARPPARDLEPRFRALADGGDPRALVWLLGQAESLRPQADERRTLRQALCRELVERHVAGAWFREHGLATLGRERAGLGDAYVPLLLAVAAWADGAGAVETKVLALATAARALSASSDEQDRVLGLELYERILAEEAGAPGVAALRAEYLRRKLLRVGMLAPDVEYATPAGERHALSELRGDVVLIDFWGLWCPQCMRELPELKELAARFADERFTLLGVATDVDPEAFAVKVRELGVTWPQAWDGGKRGAIATAWGIDEFPTKLLLDRAGRVRHFNPRVADLGRLIEALLREPVEPVPGSGGGER
jgi:peroxiredoxin